MEKKTPEALAVLDAQIDIHVIKVHEGLADDLRKARAAFAELYASARASRDICMAWPTRDRLDAALAAVEVLK
ncbi:MAG: hypothetical protein KGI54_06955 [Pseudomonadota bacterium]|nr:hypothetical protein [Pseudomonadota bacterium]